MKWYKNKVFEAQTITASCDTVTLLSSFFVWCPDKVKWVRQTHRQTETCRDGVLSYPVCPLSAAAGRDGSCRHLTSASPRERKVTGSTCHKADKERKREEMKKEAEREGSTMISSSYESEPVCLFAVWKMKVMKQSLKGAQKERSSGISVCFLL